MNAFLINPFTKTITSVDYNGDYKSIYSLLGRGVSAFDCVGIIDEDTIYVDDEGLFKSDQAYFQCRLGNEGDYEETYYHPLAGIGLVLGGDEDGDSVSPGITLEALTDRIVWGI